MRTIYICDICGKTYSQAIAAQTCEISHDTSEDRKKAMTIKLNKLDPCDYCARAYYVYGCELDCSCEERCQDYSQFISKE